MKKSWIPQSISALIAVVILVIALFGSSKYTHHILVVVASIWLLVMLCLMFYLIGKNPDSRLARFFTAKPAKEKGGPVEGNEEDRCAEPPVNMMEEYCMPDPNDATIMVLLRHVSYRITGYIHSVFPGATWNWDIENPEQLMANGGAARIRLTGAGEYTHAVITTKKDASIKCELLRIATIEQLLNGGAVPSAAQEPQSIKSPTAWYDILGRTKIREICNNLMPRGFNWLYIAESGDVVIPEGDGRKILCELAQFPARKYWNELIEVMQSEGITASVEEDMLKVVFA